MQIETIGRVNAVPSSNSQHPTTSQKSRAETRTDESSAVLLPAGAEATKTRARYLNLSDVTKTLNKKEGEQFMSSAVKRLLRTGEENRSRQNRIVLLRGTS